MADFFADMLGHYIERSGYTLGQLARRAELPKTTIVNWANGTVRKPQQWPDLVKLALQLTLCETEANELLNSAGHPDIAVLMTRTESEGMRVRLRQLMVDRRAFSAPAPFQAIPPPPYFVGRNREIASIKKALLGGGQVTLCSLEGLGGVGKTALAAQIADELRPYFYDGVLWVRLDTADPMAALGGIAEAYGCTAGPPHIESRATQVRQILATKRALVVLDNVRSSEEVRPFLPPRGTSSVLITTRRRGLSVARGAAKIMIEPFSERGQEALELFSKILGAQVVERDRSTYTAIADLLGYLPLAVVIAASRIAYEPGWTASDFLARLLEKKTWLSELNFEDESVRVAFGVSLDALPPSDQGFFGTLGVFGGQDFSVEGAAYVSGGSMEQTLESIRRLFALSLVERGRCDRYRLHPLLRVFALEQLNDRTAHRRMIEYFTHFDEDLVSRVLRNPRDLSELIVLDASESKNYWSAIELELGNIIHALEEAFREKMWDQLEAGTHALTRYWYWPGTLKDPKSYWSRVYRATVYQSQFPMEGRALLGSLAALSDDLLASSYISRALNNVLFRDALLEHLKELSEDAHQRLEDALTMALKIGAPTQMLILNKLLVMLAIERKRFDAVEAPLRESIRIAKRMMQTKSGQIDQQP